MERQKKISFLEKRSKDTIQRYETVKMSDRDFDVILFGATGFTGMSFIDNTLYTSLLCEISIFFSPFSFFLSRFDIVFSKSKRYITDRWYCCKVFSVSTSVARIQADICDRRKKQNEIESFSELYREFRETETFNCGS